MREGGGGLSTIWGFGFLKREKKPADIITGFLPVAILNVFYLRLACIMQENLVLVKRVHGCSAVFRSFYA